MSRILMVDDSPTEIVVAKKALEGKGHTVITAHDGVEALAIYADKQTDLDIILLDCLMPKMDGYETTQRIRELENTDARPAQPRPTEQPGPSALPKGKGWIHIV